MFCFCSEGHKDDLVVLSKMWTFQFRLYLFAHIRVLLLLLLICRVLHFIDENPPFSMLLFCRNVTARLTPDLHVPKQHERHFSRLHPCALRTSGEVHSLARRSRKSGAVKSLAIWCTATLNARTNSELSAVVVIVVMSFKTLRLLIQNTASKATWRVWNIQILDVIGGARWLSG